MFKSIVRILTFLIIVLSVNVHTFANPTDNPVVFLNNQQIYISDVQPTIVDGTTLIPVHGMFENMRCIVEWNEANRCVHIQRNSLVIALQIENTQMTFGTVQGKGNIDTSVKELEVAPCIINGRTMIPLRAISQSLGARVEWITESHRINIYDESITSDFIIETPINNQTPYIKWNDRGVEQCVRDVLGLPMGHITFENCANIYELDLRGYSVNNIFDLIYFPNLKSLYVEDVRYIDLAPLYELYNLTQLSVVNCNVFDLSPLRHLTSLKNLCLDYNEIEDISCLSELTELRYLSLYSNMIEEVDKLWQLQHLKELNLGSNPIEDISCIADLISQEYSDVLDSLIMSDYGDSLVFVSMHYEGASLIVEMAVEEF